MTDYGNYHGLTGLIAFHGHMCPGLAIGYRATTAALEQLGIERAADEELIAIVENDSCSVDAVQQLAGATFGKGNLFFRDWGKQVFTFARRDSNRAIRVAVRPDTREAPASSSSPGIDARQQRIDYILDAPADTLFDIRETTIELPPRAEIHRSVICDNCGEPAMETRTVEQHGKRLCLSCATS